MFKILLLKMQEKTTPIFIVRSTEAHTKINKIKLRVQSNGRLLADASHLHRANGSSIGSRAPARVWLVQDQFWAGGGQERRHFWVCWPGDGDRVQM